MNKIHLKSIVCFLMLSLILSSCSKDEVEPPPTAPREEEEVPKEPDILSDEAYQDIGNMNIGVDANANYWGLNDPSLVKSIAGDRQSYCHPDVQYFPNGLHGYKFCMVFTPYFGIIGSSGNAAMFENPTVVVSNDALHWSTPSGLTNPIQLPPRREEGEYYDAQNRKQGYWSDVDWLYHNNQFELYYRGNGVSQKSLRKIAANSANNERKLAGPSAERNIVRQLSSDGVNWSPLEIAYTSNPPATLYDNHVISPSFVRVGNEVLSYEVNFNTGKEGYTESAADLTFVLQRKSSNGLDFTDFADSKFIHFVNKPWLYRSSGYAPWHLDVCYTDGYYILTLAVGSAMSYVSDQVYLAFSKDGLKFHVHPKPIVQTRAYRSTIFPMETNDEEMRFGAVIGLKSGEFKSRKFSVKKKLLSKLLG